MVFGNNVSVPHFSASRSRSHTHSSRLLPGSRGSWGSAYAWMPLLFDTTVLALTVLRTLGLVRSGRAGNIVRTLLRDGIMYYSSASSAIAFSAALPQLS